MRIKFSFAIEMNLNFFFTNEKFFSNILKKSLIKNLNAELLKTNPNAKIGIFSFSSHPFIKPISCFMILVNDK